MIMEALAASYFSVMDLNKYFEIVSPQCGVGQILSEVIQGHL